MCSVSVVLLRGLELMLRGLTGSKKNRRGFPLNVIDRKLFFFLNGLPLSNMLSICSLPDGHVK